jgi:hypothetical protein
VGGVTTIDDNFCDTEAEAVEFTVPLVALIDTLPLPIAVAVVVNPVDGERLTTPAGVAVHVTLGAVITALF